MKLAYGGEQKAKVMGKMQTGRQYEGRDSAEQLNLLVTTDGIVAAATLGGAGIPAGIRLQADAVDR